MTKYTATFSNGQTAKRSSDRTYAFAWAVIRIEDDMVENFGFSADRANAAKGAAAVQWKGISARDRRNAALCRLHAKMAKEQGFASVDALHAHWDERAAAHNAARRIEIVAL
jgi:hypothetical protein